MRQGIPQKFIASYQLGLIITLICIMFFSHTGNTNPLNDRVNQQAEYERLTKQLKKIQLQLKEDIKKHSLIEFSFSETEIKIGVLATQLRQQKKQAQAMASELAHLKQQQILLDQKKSKQYSLLAKHIEQTYLLDEKNQLKILLNQTNPENFDRQINYLQSVNQARQQQLDNYRQLVNENNRLAKTILSKQKVIDRNQNLLLTQTSELNNLQQQRQQQLLRLQSTISTKQSAALTLERDSEALKALLSVVIEVIQKEKKPLKKQIVVPQKPVGDHGFAQAKGSLPWPVDGNPSTLFGSKRAESGIPWEGITLTAQLGEPVHAIFSGHVVFSDWFQGQGLLMIIDHGQDYLSLYSHNQSLLKNTGDWVVGGETVATVGNSGGQPQSGLYFEIRHDGQPQDPKSWCTKQ